MSYEFACTKLAETEMAIKVTDHASGEVLWFPLSAVQEMHFHTKTGHGSMIVEDWIAKEKGLL